MRVRSVVGLVPIAAVSVIDDALLVRLPEFTSRLHWFLDHKPAVAAQVARVHGVGSGQQHLFSVLSPERLVRVLEAVLDEAEFLSPYGIRSLVQAALRALRRRPRRRRARRPGQLRAGRVDDRVVRRQLQLARPDLVPAEPAGHRRHRAVRQLHRQRPHGRAAARVGPPGHPGRGCRRAVASPGGDVRAHDARAASPPPRATTRGREGLLWFHEYFHGETGKGLGASHQTGWTSLVVDLLLHQAYLRP